MFGFRHSKEPPYLPREVEPGNIESYIQNRLDDQIMWYDQKAQQAQNTYKRMQFFELIVAAAIPLLANYTVSCPAIAFIVGLLGAIVTVIEGTERLGRYHENWIEYRSACETLKHEKNLYLMGAFPYGTDETAEQLFVHNIENLLSSEGNKWKSSNSAVLSTKEKSQSGTGS